MDKRITITITHLQSIFDIPPVLNLINCLLDMNINVNLVSYDVDKLDKSVLEHQNFKYKTRSSIVFSGNRNRIKRFITNHVFGKKETVEFMKESDYLWTPTDTTVRFLGDTVLKYKHIMQLMELIPGKCLSINYGLMKFPIAKYAQNAVKVVVPEINRAYIQKTWWDLKETPMVLPNKPYNNIDESEIENGIDSQSIETIKNETRKIILYLGGICPDRSLENYAEAVTRLGDDFCLYIVGRPMGAKEEEILGNLIKKYSNVVYLGFFKAPSHLFFAKYAYIGLLPYKTTNEMKNISALNALYCAPNKIYEYAKYGVPMVGSDVIGLLLPFEKYNIGVCTKDEVQCIVDALITVDRSHATMSQNCHIFYEDTDFKKIVSRILN